MTTQATNDYSYRMAKTSGIVGIIAACDYFYSATGILPTPSLKIGYPIFWLFGPMLVVASHAFYHFFKLQGQRSILLEYGKIFMVLAGAMVCLMGTMQAVSREHFDLLGIMYPPDSASEAFKMGFRGANSIQSGTDLAWDTFIFGATIFNSMFFITQKVGWRILGIIGVIIGILGLLFNYAAWPANPGNAGLVDLGPLAGIWYLAACIFLLVQMKQLSTPEGATSTSTSVGR